MLHIGNAAYGPGIYIMDGTINHNVSDVTAGERFSLVSYAKHLNINTPKARVLELLQQGFPMPLVVPPDSDSVLKPIVISMDSEEGRTRRTKLNYEYELAPGTCGEDVPAWVKEKMKTRATGDNLAGIHGCFYSHYNVWQQLGDRPAIILEDDAFKVRDYNIQEFPQHGITMLAGALRTPGAWKDEDGEWIKNGNFLQTLCGLKPGINDIGNCKFTCAMAYYLPPGMAARLVQKVAQDVHVSVVDVYMRKSGFIESLWFPNPYVESEGVATQTGTPKKFSAPDFYATNEMIGYASKTFGFPFPATGASLTEWQVAVRHHEKDVPMHE